MSAHRLTNFSILATLLGITAVGCGGEEPPAKAPETTSSQTSVSATPPPPDTSAATTPPASDTSSTGGSAGVASTGGASDTGGSSTTTVALSDEQIAAITAAADSGEVEQGRIAAQKAKDPKVKQFAQHMVKDHGEAKQKQAQLVKKANITPAEGSVSQEVTSDGQKIIEQLKTATGADFDKAYIAAQIDEHQKVLDAIDNKLLPNVKNADLKGHLNAIRPKIEAHLKMAQEIQGSLGAGTTSTSGSTGANGSHGAHTTGTGDATDSAGTTGKKK